MIAISIPWQEAEAYYVQGWTVTTWRSFPHRAYALLAVRDAS